METPSLIVRLWKSFVRHFRKPKPPVGGMSVEEFVARYRHLGEFDLR